MHFDARRETSSVDCEATLSLLKRSLLKITETQNADLFRKELSLLLQSEYADSVLKCALEPDGKTVLHLAVEAGFHDAVRMLLATDKIDLLAVTESTGFTVLHLAVSLHDTAMVRVLLQVPEDEVEMQATFILAIRELIGRKTLDSTGATALHLAVENDSLEIIRVLFECASRIYDTRSTSAEENSEREGSKMICSLGATNGDTALHWAVIHRRYEIAHLICSRFKDSLHNANSEGQTPLIMAKHIVCDDDMVKILSSYISCGAEDLQLYSPNIPPKDLSVADGSNFSIKQIGSTLQQRENLQMINCSVTKYVGVTSKQVLEAERQLSSGSNDIVHVIMTRSKRRSSKEIDNLSCDLSTKKPVNPSLNASFELPYLRNRQLHYQSIPKKRFAKRLVRRKSLVDPDEYYPMAKRRRGICLIINNMTYWHPKFTDRGGCIKDERRIEKVFGNLGFLVKLLRNLSTDEMDAQMKILGTKTDHSNYDCFAAVIMSHGGQGSIYGVNGSVFPLQSLSNYFTSDKCTSLAGKPKLFFIQACRGDDYQLGYAVSSSSPTPASNIDKDVESQDCQITIQPRSKSFSISNELESDDEICPPALAAASREFGSRIVPAFADFLVSYATMMGFKAQRDPKKGSVYIQSLCKYLEMYGRQRSLLDIVTSVHRVVSESVFRESSEDGGGTLLLQTPEVRHTLTRRVQFV